MKTLAFDSAVIGGGAAGMAAALKLSEEGFSAVLIDREACLGGILNQCIHPGFGMHRFGEDLTGPEYAGRDIGMLTETKVKALTGTTVTDIRDLAGEKELVCYSAAEGVVFVRARTVVLAMGCRERNRGNIRIPGTRPAGVFTAGFAQRLVNIEGLVPGRNVVILGSGDIGLIMARRMHWIGCRVLAVIEIQPYPSGLTRNIVQCLNDYDIPLYLSHLITGISGKNRIESVTVTPLKEGLPDESGSFVLPCDTLLLSVGLIPENELTKKAGAVLDSGTGGPLVDSRLMTTIPGIFACGNVLHVHDLVDYASDEAGRAGTAAARYMRGEGAGTEWKTLAGANVRYVVPGRLNPYEENTLYLRSMIVKNGAGLILSAGGIERKRIRLPHVQPSEMVSLTLKAGELLAGNGGQDNPEVEVSIR